MVVVIGLLSVASTLLALVVTYQVKFAGTEVFSIIKYNLIVLPVIFAANIFIGLGINKGHVIIKNLPLLIAIQTLIYYVMITVLSIYILGNNISVPKTVVAFMLIIIGVYLLQG
jgi:hypothetical protein